MSSRSTAIAVLVQLCLSLNERIIVMERKLLVHAHNFEDSEYYRTEVAQIIYAICKYHDYLRNYVRQLELIQTPVSNNNDRTATPAA